MLKTKNVIKAWAFPALRGSYFNWKLVGTPVMIGSLRVRYCADSGIGEVGLTEPHVVFCSFHSVRTPRTCL